jgi:glutathione S-transferase
MLTDPRGLASMHQWLQWQATTFGDSTTDVMMETVYLAFFGRKQDPEKYAAAMEKVRKDLGVLETSLKGKEYLCGKLSLADFSIVSCLLMRKQMGVELEAFPNVKSWVARMEDRESVRKSLPPL